MAPGTVRSRRVELGAGALTIERRALLRAGVIEAGVVAALADR